MTAPAELKPVPELVIVVQPAGGTELPGGFAGAPMAWQAAGIGTGGGTAI